ncbi:unnamed protein product [Acanthoscelides obtectus]|nr:unnamed protein product [Acanthoscelides obtectus]CAK1630807.1 Serine/threonine-protein kinase haspin [Acanthoscelides obtectus]
MVPKNKLKTYAGPNKSLVNTSVDVFNKLLAKNLSRRIIGVRKNRKQKKTFIKELPERAGRTLLTDDSFHISTEDTFDKLLKTSIKNNVGRRSLLKYGNKSSRSPVWTRSKSKSFSRIENSASQNGLGSLVKTSGVSESASQGGAWQISDASKTKHTSCSVCRTPVRMQPDGSVSQHRNIFQASDRQHDKSSSNFLLQRFQQTTIDPVYDSIAVEVVKPARKSVYSPISYIKVPDVSKIKNVSADTTLPYSFVKSFRDQPVANSTPFQPNRHRTVFQSKEPDTLEGTNILQKSLAEIQSWGEKVPDFTDPAKETEKSRSSLDALPELYGFAHSAPVTSEAQRRRCSLQKFTSSAPERYHNTHSLVVSLEEFNQFQSKNSFYISGQNSNGVVHSMSGSEHTVQNDFVTKRRRIVKNVSTDDNLLTRECLVVVERCDEAYKNQLSRRSHSSDNTSVNSVCSNVSDKEFEDFYAKNHQSVKEQYATDRRQLVVKLTNIDISKSLKITNTANSDLPENSHNKDSRKLSKSYKSNKVELSNDLGINVTRHDCPVKDLVVNLTLDKFDTNTAQTEPKIEEKNLVIELTLNDFMNVDKYENSSKLVDVSCQVNAVCSQIIDLTDSIQNVTKTDHRYSETFTETKITNINNCDGNAIPEETNDDQDQSNSDNRLTNLDNTLLDTHGKRTEEMKNEVDNLNELSVNGSVDVIDSSLIEARRVEENIFKVPEPIKKKSVLLRAGKHWRRSLSVYKNVSIISEDVQDDDGASGTSSEAGTTTNDTLSGRNKRVSVRIVPSNLSVITRKSRKTSVLKYYAAVSGYVPTEAEQREQQRGREENLENSFNSLSIREPTLLQLHRQPVTAREIVLSRCQQAEPWKFLDCYPDSVLQHCQKIGEGVYGEVYLLRNPKGGTSVLKIIPIEGSLMVNGERQKKYEEILSEIIISMELSNLRKNPVNSTSGFTELQEVKCVQGCYPERLIDLWHLYDETKGSENDCPDCFLDDQLYIILQLADAGKDLESFVFANAQQALAMFKQVAFALAVAEEELHFEHRDLHWGNILLKQVDKSTKIRFTLNGNTYIVPTKGIQATIIDFTLSRVEHDGVVIFNDLSLDPDLFTAEGDYQFDIYRLMQKENG